MAEKQFKYFRQDFHPLTVKLRHMELYINFLDSCVEVKNIMDISALTDLDKIELDARDLEIVSVSWEQSPSGLTTGDSAFKYLRDINRLTVIPDRIIRSGEEFKLRTVTKCVPSDNILEGIYKDVTPPGAPQQYMSQCQQWGFQRIAPVFDDCRAKCRMLTTIEADARYTNLISNGAIDPVKNPDGIPILKPGDPSRKLITYRNDIPMAPYLFIVSVGTWDSLVDHVTYDSGKTVRLEYLVPIGRASSALIPMQILKESILWVKATQDYEYKSDVYRTICMTKSNFGGMENVGNTTIVTDAALIDEHTTDMSLLYAHSVVVHEFEHNQCGSETTMETPFDVWLNEAYTVVVERNFLEDTFDPTFIRLNQVDSIRSPLLGPLAIEDTGNAGIIVRKGFNDPDELIDSVTYVKAAEVIRMLRMLLGAATFKKGKELYFSRYKDSNANTDQFFECFEETSGRDLKQFKECWLYRIGYPKVAINTKYDPKSRTYRIGFSQQKSESGALPFHMPVELALIDHNGNIVEGTSRVFEFNSLDAELIFQNITTEPAFASLNRDYSFYGTCHKQNENQADLIRQVRLEDNLFNRIEAFRRFTDLQRVRLLNQPDARIDQGWIDLFGELLTNRNIASSAKSFLLRIDEQPLDRSYSSWHTELVFVREKLTRMINTTYKAEIVGEFESLDTYKEKSSPKDGIEDRILKQTLLELIVVDDAPDSHALIREHYKHATSATDKIGALLAINRSSMNERIDVLERTYHDWKGNLSAYANYLRVISSGWKSDLFETIEKERGRPTFDIANPTWARALFLTMAGNTKKIWTAEGVNWATRVIIELAPMNTYVASKLLNVFQDFKRMRPNLKPLVGNALKTIINEVSEEMSPTVNRQALSYLE
ncbi:MAG: M1 family metallopeptidase [Syntrophaceae bacterium]|nr:M1 family metallopeptidase [Syntrophaceae bacterium]